MCYHEYKGWEEVSGRLWPWLKMLLLCRIHVCLWYNTYKRYWTYLLTLHEELSNTWLHVCLPVLCFSRHITKSSINHLKVNTIDYIHIHAWMTYNIVIHVALCDNNRAIIILKVIHIHFDLKKNLEWPTIFYLHHCHIIILPVLLNFNPLLHYWVTI